MIEHLEAALAQAEADGDTEAADAIRAVPAKFGPQTDGGGAGSGSGGNH